MGQITALSKSTKLIIISFGTISITMLLLYIINKPADYYQSVVNKPVDNYQVGISYYNKRDYRNALSYLKEVKTDNKNYNDAKAKIIELASIVQSLDFIKSESAASSSKPQTQVTGEIESSPMQFINQWFALNDQNRQNYIEERLGGKWVQVVQVALNKDYFPYQIIKVQRDFKTERNQKGYAMCVQEFNNHKVSTYSLIKHKENNWSEAYRLDNNVITYPEQTAMLTDRNEILYISKNLLVTDEGVGISYYIKFDGGIKANYNEELTLLLKSPLRDDRIKFEY